jgi:hypothetical protein
MTLSQLSDVMTERGARAPERAEDAADPLQVLIGGLGPHELARLSRLLRQRQRRRTELWTVTELLVLLAGLAAGAIILLAAWIGASGTSRYSSLVGWAAFGVAGPAVAGMAAASWILSGLRTIQRDRAEMGARVAELAATRAIGGTPPVRTRHAVPSILSPEEFVASKGMTRYHRPDCLMVKGKAVAAASVLTHRSAGRVPCGMCLPSC